MILCAILFTLILLPSISGLSGVSPASYNIDFEPNLKQEFSFSFIFDKGVKADAYVGGGLSEYVTIVSDKYAFGRKVVVVELDLPEKIDVPGLHRIRVGAKERLSDSLSGVSVGVDVGGIIKLRVPYPGKYAELGLTAATVNAGEDVSYQLSIHSRGDENIFVEPQIIITNEGGKVEEFSLEAREVKSADSYVYDRIINTEKYGAGDYNITAIVNYGGESPATSRMLFRLGELRVGISNYTDTVMKDKVNRFTMEVESFWNDRIGDVYGTVSIVGYQNSATTPTISLKPWQKTTINGFLDTTGIEEDIVKAVLEVHYENKVTTKEVDLRLIKETNWLIVWAVIGGILIVLLILILLLAIVILLFRRKKK